MFDMNAPKLSFLRTSWFVATFVDNICEKSHQSQNVIFFQCSPLPEIVSI